MAIEFIEKNKQASGNFNNGEILENKPTYKSEKKNTNRSPKNTRKS